MSEEQQRLQIASALLLGLVSQPETKALSQNQMLTKDSYVVKRALSMAQDLLDKNKNFNLTD